MAPPAYIITPNFFQNSLVDDVQDIIDDLATLLVANGWTQPVAGTFQCPADPWGRYFKVAFTRTSQTRLQAAMTDNQLRTTETREMRITGTQTIRYYYGTRYLYIENGNQEDNIYATLLSLAPESETVHDCYCIFFGSRDNAGNLSNYRAGACISVRKDTNAYDTQGSPTPLMFLNFGAYASGGQATDLIHASGARRWYPAWTLGQDAAATYRLRGRLYNVLLMRFGFSTIGTEYTVPIDNATTGVFRIINMLYNANNYYYMAVRKS